MNGIESCPKCGVSLISEEISKHICANRPKITRIVDIEYSSWTAAELEEYGGQVVIIFGKDGTVIRATPALNTRGKNPDDEQNHTGSAP